MFLYTYSPLSAPNFSFFRLDDIAVLEQCLLGYCACGAASTTEFSLDSRTEKGILSSIRELGCNTSGLSVDTVPFSYSGYVIVLALQPYSVGAVEAAAKSMAIEGP